MWRTVQEDRSRMADESPPSTHALTSLLTPYGGAQPPAPDWFRSAVSTPYVTEYVTVSGARIHYQCWGERDRPGLLLVHGNGAHAHWYDFIAPCLADEYYVVAMTFSGMGDSDWRDKYTISGFSAEQIEVCQQAGLFQGPQKPFLIAHSFGGFVSLQTGAYHSEKFAGLMIVDSPIRPPDDPWNGPPSRPRGNRIYADLNSALARFRLAPPQDCEHHFIVDYIARHSLKQVPLKSETDETGWTWKFDPFIWQHFESENRPADMVSRISCPLSFVRGETSGLMSDRIWTYMSGLRPDADFVSIAKANHHVMLDQPLAFVSVVRRQLQAWSG